MLGCFSKQQLSAPVHSFGARAVVDFNLDQGSFDLYIDSILVLKDGYAQAIVDGQLLNTKAYEKHHIAKKPISDDKYPSKGTVVEVRHQKSGSPTIVQHFYIFDEQPYIVTELQIIGDNLSSRSISPIVAEAQNPKEGSQSFMKVPYDNDTFIRYDTDVVQAGITSQSAEVSSLYNNETRKGLVIGSLSQSLWKTGILIEWTDRQGAQIEALNGFVDAEITRDSILHGLVKADTLKSSRVFVGYYNDWRSGMSQYAEQLKIETPRYVQSSFETPYSWNSWGAVQTKLNLENASAVVDFFADSIPYFRNNGVAYIGLDSYWDNMIDGGLEGDFSKLREFADYCRKKGLKPGIYWAPFVDWFKENRRVEGSQYEYEDVWTKTGNRYHDIDGARAMDPTHPATRARIDLVIDKFNDIGFKLIKIDFIGHASVEANSFYDKNVSTGMQAFHSGMQYLIDKIDNKMLIYVAISPSLATYPYAHSRRIACDAYADIAATEYTLNSTTYGWWLGDLYDFIDADHIVFGKEEIAVNRARLSSAIINGTITLGDDYSVQSKAVQHAKELLNNPALLQMVKDGEAFIPVEHKEDGEASEVFVKHVDTNLHYIAIMNYHARKQYKLPLSRLNIPSGNYQMLEVYSGIEHLGQLDQGFETIVGARDSKLFILRKKK